MKMNTLDNYIMHDLALKDKIQKWEDIDLRYCGDNNAINHSYGILKW